MNVREAALKTLYEIEYEGAYSNLALKKTQQNFAGARDRAFLSALVYGTLDKKITLDYVIARYSKLKLKKISKYILLILRMGVYQLKFMDKVPQRAAVDESVKLARRYGHRASSGFVNGVLRTVSQNEIEYPKDKTEYLSVKYSFPKELCDRWTGEFGYEFTEDLLKAYGISAPLTLRVNTLKTTTDELLKLLKEKGVNATGKDNYILSEGFDIAGDDLYKNGMYTVQDRAAQRATEILAPQKGDRVMDMCAAPGGKTTHIAEIMENEGEITAFDIHEHKIDLIKKNAQRLGIDIIDAKIGDGREFNEKYSEWADKILCDVPCSGYGIIRRKPEIKYNREDISALPQVQRQILDNAAKYLKKGGEVVYSTCTIEKDENEGVTDGFLEDKKNFEKLYEKTFYPHTDNTDGFYICKMRKKND